MTNWHSRVLCAGALVPLALIHLTTSRCHASARFAARKLA
jgi:hypothetical protein